MSDNSVKIWKETVRGRHKMAVVLTKGLFGIWTTCKKKDKIIDS